MGAGSVLALMARRSLLLTRQHSTLTAADISPIDCERPSHVTHAQLAQEQPQPAGAPQLHLLSGFHMDLAERLQQLQIQGTGSAHLNWLLDALASAVSTHSSLQSVFTSAGAAANPRSASSVLKLHRADEVLSMLDVCTALKQVADDMDHQFGSLHHALQSVGHALSSDKALSSGRLRAAAHKLSAWILQDRPQTGVICVTGKDYRPLAEARSSLRLAAKKVLQSAATSLDPMAALLSQALDGALLTSMIVLDAAVSSLAPPAASARKCSGARKSMIIKNLGRKISSTTPWATLLRQLHQDLRQEDVSAAGGCLFQELRGLHAAAVKLHAIITTSAGAPPMELAIDVKQSLESLHKRLREAQSCVSLLRMQLVSFFQALIALRLALIDTSSAETA